MSEPARIAVLEPDALSRSVIARILRGSGYSPVLFESEVSLFRTPGFGQAECLIVNGSLPLLSATHVQLVLNSVSQRMPLIVISDGPTIERTVRAMRVGAVDVVPAPVAPHHLLRAVEHAVTLRAREREGRAQHAATPAAVL